MATKEHIVWHKATEEEISEGSPEMIEVSRETIIVDEMPLNWAGLRLTLMTSQAFIRILSNSANVNMIAYGALQTILSTESNEQHLLQMLQLTMNFAQEEKDEINLLLENNFFTIRL